MTREQLVSFLEQNYEPDEQLVWQTISFDDVVDGIEKRGIRVGEESWASFIESLDTYNRLAENFSDNTFSEFYDFLTTEPEDNN